MDFKHGILKTALQERERHKMQNFFKTALEERERHKMLNLQLSFSTVRRHTSAVAGGITPLILNPSDRYEWPASRSGRFIP